jgi:hypothetical protein
MEWILHQLARMRDPSSLPSMHCFFFNEPHHRPITLGLVRLFLSHVDWM